MRLTTRSDDAIGATNEIVRLGVSACLLGEEVRYDGGHKRDRFLTDTFGRFVEWVQVCPEVESGMDTPRPAMRLVRAPGQSVGPTLRPGADPSVRLLTIKDGLDLTEQMRDFSAKRVKQLARMDLDGYVLKKDSPSCGLFRVKVYGESGPGERSGRGLFAEALCSALPLLPVEEEGRLSDPPLRENFIERVFAYKRLRALFARRLRTGDLVAFHTAHKLVLLAHSPSAYTALGRMVAAGKGDASRLREAYGSRFMAALSTPATRGRHANVLQHMAGYFKTQVDAVSRAHIAETIADYQRGLVPLVVPVTLIAHQARAHQVRYLLDQVYLQPHPKELMLRNHV